MEDIDLPRYLSETSEDSPPKQGQEAAACQADSPSGGAPGTAGPGRPGTSEVAPSRQGAGRSAAPREADQRSNAYDRMAHGTVIAPQNV